jgi:hypothetical protein
MNISLSNERLVMNTNTSLMKIKNAYPFESHLKRRSNGKKLKKVGPFNPFGSTISLSLATQDGKSLHAANTFKILS